MHEGIPIINFHVPKAFMHEYGKLTGVVFEKVAAKLDDKGRRQLVPTGEPDVHFACDDVLVAVGQENAFPWIERDTGIEFDVQRPAGARSSDVRIDASQCLFRRRCRLRPEEHHLGGRARPRGRHFHRPVLPGQGRDAPSAADGQSRLAEDGHPRVELRQRRVQRCALQGAAQGRVDRAQEHQGRGRARVRSGEGVRGSAALPQLRRADGVRAEAVHRVRRLRRHLPDGLHHLHRRWRGGRASRAPQRAGAQPDAGHLRLRRTQDRSHHGQGRGRVPALRPVRGALPDRRVGHAEVPARASAGQRPRAPRPSRAVGSAICDRGRDRGDASSPRRRHHEERRRADRARQRFRRQVRQRQRLRIGVGEPAVRQVDPAHGHSGGAAQHLPVEHPGIADVVRGAHQRGGLARRAAAAST